MEIVWSKKIDEILRVGQWLNSFGVRNWALTKNQALVVLDQFLHNKIAVLGGDVFVKRGNIIISNYDNWYCNRLEREADDDFLMRSINKAKIYITTYKDDREQIYFVIVPEILKVSKF